MYYRKLRLVHSGAACVCGRDRERQTEEGERAGLDLTDELKVLYGLCMPPEAPQLRHTLHTEPQTTFFV